MASYAGYGSAARFVDFAAKPASGDRYTPGLLDMLNLPKGVRASRHERIQPKRET
jgi:hypothetical protein